MKGVRFVLVTVAGCAAALAGSTVVRAQQPPAQPAPAPPSDDLPPVGEPGMRMVSGQSAVVGGNAAAARERALDEALRQAVSQALAEILDAPTRAAQAKGVKALEARARSFVRRYRTLEEGETGGNYGVRLEAEVDEVALRRATEPWGQTQSPGAGRPGPVELTLVVSGAAELGPLLAGALGSAGVRVRLAPAPPPGQAAPPPLAPRSGEPPHVAVVRAQVTEEGPVRGTGKVAVACRADLRVTTAQMLAFTEHTATPRAFADRDDTARAECLRRAVAELVPRLAAVGGGGAPVGADLRTVMIEADVVEPGAVALLLRAIRSIGAVSSAELRRLTPGRADIRVRTRLLAPALAPSLTRDTGGMITLGNVEVAADHIRLRARLRAAPVPPAP